MIINNIEEFKQYVDSLFSCKHLSEKDKEKMKEAIDLAMKNIPNAHEKMKFICEYEIDRTFGPEEEKIFFGMNRLTQDENKDIILYFIEKRNYFTLDTTKLLTKMLDFIFEEDEKIKISSKISCENLFELMDNLNWLVKKGKFFRKKYYKNYYNIFREALEGKAQQ